MDLTAAGFGATLTGALPELRSMAESLMTDTVTVRRATGETTQDPDTGSTVPVYADLFTSKCKVQARNLTALTAEAGGRTATTVRLELHLPLSADAVKAGDVAEITAVGALSDVQLLGRKFRITAPVAKSYATARRYEVEEVVS
jgi:hypothetical protein